MKVKLIILLFVSVCTINVKAQDNATKILDNALAQAKAENKHVFIKYSASWCGWCKKMDKQMKSDNCEYFFDTSYVIVNLVVRESKTNKHLENPGALDLLIKHKGEKAGLPFWVILNKDGDLIEDSFNSEGDNLGCPATKEEVDLFVGILKNSSNLTDENLAIIAETFQMK